LDTNGALPGGVIPIFGSCTICFDETPFTGIVAAIANAQIPGSQYDTRNELGTPNAPANAGYPSLIGNFHVNWNGLGQGAARLYGHQYAFTTTNNMFGPTTNSGDRTVLFGIPEPATTTLIALAIVAIAGSLKHRRC